MIYFFKTKKIQKKEIYQDMKKLKNYFHFLTKRRTKNKRKKDFRFIILFFFI